MLSVTFCRRRARPKSPTLHTNSTSAAPAIEARTTGRACSTDSWLRANRAARNTAFRANAPLAESVVLNRAPGVAGDGAAATRAEDFANSRIIVGRGDASNSGCFRTPSVVDRL